MGKKVQILERRLKDYIYKQKKNGGTTVKLINELLKLCVCEKETQEVHYVF